MGWDLKFVASKLARTMLICLACAHAPRHANASTHTCIHFCSQQIFMVLREITTQCADGSLHALVTGSTTSAGKWIRKDQSLCHQLLETLYIEFLFQY
jgi:hypothetical protein